MVCFANKQTNKKMIYACFSQHAFERTCTCDTSILYCFLLKLKTDLLKILLYSYIVLNVYFIKISQTPSIWFKVKETILVWQRYPQKLMLFREVRTFILVFMQEGEQMHLRSQSILPCPGSQKPLLSTLQRDWSHAWFKAGLPPHMLEGLCEEMQTCLLSHIPPHTLVSWCWEDPARGLGAGASTQTHKLAGSHVFRLRTVHPMLSFTRIRESTRTPYVFIG